MKHKPFPYTLNPAEIPTAKVVDVTPESGCAEHVNYACPEACWGDHLDAWRKARRQGVHDAPNPMPYGHCMFDDPIAYGCVRYGDASEASKRAAWDKHVRSMLHGWDADLRPEQLERIVQITVDAKMKGVNLGAAPFVACIETNL